MTTNFPIFEVNKVKDKIIVNTLILGCALESISFIISILDWENTNFKLGISIDFSAIILFYSALLLRKKFSLELRTFFVITGLLFLVFADLYRNGVYSENKILMILVPIFIFLGYNLRMSILIFIAIALIYLGFAYLYHTSILKPTKDYYLRALSIDVWVINFLLITTVAFIIVIIIKQLVDIYNKLIVELKHRNIELNKAKEYAEESELQFKNLFEGAADAIFIADEESGILLDANAAANSLMQMRKDEIIGLHQSRLHPKTEETFLPILLNNKQKISIKEIIRV